MAKESIKDLVKQGTDLLSTINSNLEGAIVLFKKWQIILQTKLQESAVFLIDQDMDIKEPSRYLITEGSVRFFGV